MMDPNPIFKDDSKQGGYFFIFLDFSEKLNYVAIFTHTSKEFSGRDGSGNKMFPLKIITFTTSAFKVL